MNYNEMLKIRIETDLKWCKLDLVAKLKSLTDSLNHEIELLENNENYTPNSMGIIQGEASTIDNLCGKINALDGINKMLK
jgi:hypothetical protein|nr:MAG TPA: hypothetical protein [Caudoviricetes sp.]